MLKQHHPVGTFNVEIYVATGIRSVIKGFPYSTFLSVCSLICLVGFILLIKPNMTPDWSIAKKPSHLEGRMSIASLLCDPATTLDKYSQPYSRNMLKNMDNVHKLVSMISESKSHSDNCLPGYIGNCQ
jgi:hypothetical protein